ncbi:Uncharacterized protein DBV15_06983 [Temnothorax longispinosus]|uniref:Uncharacterized protein n=1 Tax=Temnothorax longispinosus TaxID=300112 RepID=A0A4S2KQ45_9HYME|nr:Uncharacterized protein DBV15_06983 [Temnothorax longispinosus]
MHRGGGSAGGAAGGGIVGGAGGSHRALELEHPSAMPGAPGFHWGAMFAGHHAAAAAGMMQPPMSAGGEYVPAAAHHGPAHPAMPMDLHVHQGFPYFPTRLHLTPIRVDMNKKSVCLSSRALAAVPNRLPQKTALLCFKRSFKPFFGRKTSVFSVNAAH